MKRAFLSHSSSDGSAVERIAREFIVNGVEVWLDKWEIRAGDSIIDKISSGLMSNDILIIFLSRKAVRSPWVARELNVALTGELKSRHVKVIPVLLEKCEIPAFLLDKRYVDFRSVSFEKEEFRGDVGFIAAFEELVQGIAPDSTIPFYTSSVLKVAVVERVNFSLRIDKPRRNGGTIHQAMRMKPTRPMQGWRTTVTYFGAISGFSTNMTTVEYEDTSRGSRLFKIGFDRTYMPGESFDLDYHYILLDNFTNTSTNFWDFSFGVHTMSSYFRFVFARKVSKLEVYKRVSDSEVFLHLLQPIDPKSMIFNTDYGFLPSDMWLVFRWTYAE